MTQLIAQSIFSLLMVSCFVVLFFSIELHHLKQGDDTFDIVRRLNSFMARKNILQNVRW